MIRFMGNAVAAAVTYGFLLSLATYPLDEYRLVIGGVALPYAVPFLGLMILSLPFRLILSPRVSREAILCVALFCALALGNLAGSAMYGYASDLDRLKGLLYVLTPLALCPLLKDRNPDVVFAVLITACGIAVSVGWFRFFAGTAGMLSEHAIGYWGIRYLPATRNSDVLYPLALATISLYGITRYHSIGRAVCVALFMFGAAAVALSLARGAWFALAAVCLVFLGSGDRRNFGMAVGILVLGTALLWRIAPDDFIERVVERAFTLGAMGDTRVSNADRLTLIEDSISAISQHPLGVGFGNMGWVVSRGGERLWNSENGWLTIGIEGGWLALTIMGWFTVVFVSRAVSEPRNLGSFLIVALLVYLIFNYEMNSAFLWALVSMSWFYSGSQVPLVRAPLPVHSGSSGTIQG